MLLFITSSPTGDLDGRYVPDGIDNRNHFLDQLRERWPKDASVLMISAFPSDAAANDQMGHFFSHALQVSGLSCASFELWDDRSPSARTQLLSDYDVILLGGGHVPTQNAFFHSLSLRERFRDYQGIVIGISAGSMNMAGKVYAQPEEPGEATDPSYRRWLTGLGLTDINVLPHYQMVKDYMIDGLRLYQDITWKDSPQGHFIAIPDGSYIMIEDGKVSIHGEAYHIRPTGPEQI